MDLRITETNLEITQDEGFEQLLQAGSCGGTSGGCESPLPLGPSEN
ncbi:hypothetical protein GCM10008915_48880 [Bifidobacterium pullorum subsp. gallinarum]